MKIALSTLKAANTCAAVKDIRYYLQGVLIEFIASAVDTATEKAAIVCGTDGHVLFAARTVVDLADGENAPEKGTQIIVPYDVIKTAKLRHKANTFVDLIQISETQWQLGDTLFRPIDGKFPDYRCVIPDRSDVISKAQEPGNFNPELLTRARDALRLHRNDRNLRPATYQRGVYSAVVHDERNDAVVVVMPMREDFTPARYQGLNLA